ncbi:purine and uridine phosphorylase [Aspergillus homomorphus CBS 101889]|uniref:Purine and uridine phosphorylase n=1 Tax=Aspergillus homomorphus (strain CBS 101889) TaxID=1450537 RepID=A0A395HNR5_ASPHC|nr:purine and uridine phosphorylase [Aspergillus homomorphus CBS 101889]RAL07914.1 purine and uridine phosphorylase [Aspergillus homomorphus CBS 101889]
MNPPSRPLRHKDYTIACICPMGVEQAPVEAMLDEFHPDLPTNRNQNSYTLGRMGRHNVVIVILPGIGLNSAAAVTMQLLNDFPSVEFGLLVGIAGGVPDLQRGVDIRLGDVVVSKPSGTSGGVVHFAYGPALGNGRFERIGKSYRPPEVLLAAVTRMEALHRRGGSQIPLYLDQMLQKYPKMRRGNYVYQGAENDRLFEAEFDHHGGRDCADCDPERIIERELRLEDSPVVHYGAIGSSDVVVKDGRMRDRLREDLEIKCVEMEAAGVLEVVPCLVIRGICDYADSHKNKRWQPYAAAVAASYMKELLSMVPPIQVQDAILEQGMLLVAGLTKTEASSACLFLHDQHRRGHGDRTS